MSKDLDEARDEAVELLRELMRLEPRTTDRQYMNFMSIREINERLNDLGRQYVTAQANYTNMLQDWERNWESGE